MIRSEDIEDVVREVWERFKEKYSFFQPVLGFIVVFGDNDKKVKVNVVPLSELDKNGVWLNIKNKEWHKMSCHDAQVVLRRRIRKLLFAYYTYKNPEDLAKAIIEAKYSTFLIDDKVIEKN